MTWIYVLRCYNNKYYIGKTEKKIMQRYKEHLTGKGSAWTRKYKPIELVECIGGDKFDEDKKTKEYMEKYGINNVRGGSYCQITLDKVSVASIKREIRGANDKCNKCGKSGHFASKCPYTKTNKKLSVKKYCRRKGHIKKNCYASTYNDGDSSDNEESESWPCEYCGKYFDSKKGARYHEQFYCRRYKKIQKCSRCNRKGHTVKQCYATTYA